MRSLSLPLLLFSSPSFAPAYHPRRVTEAPSLSSFFLQTKQPLRRGGGVVGEHEAGGARVDGGHLHGHRLAHGARHVHGLCVYVCVVVFGWGVSAEERKTGRGRGRGRGVCLLLRTLMYFPLAPSGLALLSATCCLFVHHRTVGLIEIEHTCGSCFIYRPSIPRPISKPTTAE